MKRLLLYPVLAAAWLLPAGCQKEPVAAPANGPVELRLAHVAGTQPLAFNTPYTNGFGETFTLTRFKYYLSNLVLTDSAGRAYAVPDSYFLVDESNPGSRTLSFAVPEGRYSSLSFLIGVDSTRNVSGAQTGALDPVLDMFWTWNTGYIMAKLEGTAPASPLPNHRIEYHIGGFRGSESALRRVSLPFNGLYTAARGRTLQVHLQADVLQWFNGAHPLSIAGQPTCTAPGTLASRFADNYATQFTLTAVQQQ